MTISARRRGILLYLGGVGVILALVIGVQLSSEGGGHDPGQASGSETGRGAPTAPRDHEEGFSPSLDFGPGPLIGGTKIPFETAGETLSNCDCPQVPADGPASANNFRAAWVDTKGEVAYEFDDGLLLTYSPEDRTTQEYLAGVEDLIASGDGEGTVITSVRGTRGMGNDSPETQSSLSWIEGGQLISLYGKGGQSMAELRQIAGSLLPPVNQTEPQAEPQPEPSSS